MRRAKRKPLVTISIGTMQEVYLNLFPNTINHFDEPAKKLSSVVDVPHEQKQPLT